VVILLVINTGRLYPTSSGDISIRHRVTRRILATECDSAVTKAIKLFINSQNKISWIIPPKHNIYNHQQPSTGVLISP